MDDLAAGILVLTLAGEGDREHLAVGALAHQLDAGYFIVSRLPRFPSTHSIVASS